MISWAVLRAFASKPSPAYLRPHSTKRWGHSEVAVTTFHGDEKQQTTGGVGNDGIYIKVDLWYVDDIQIRIDDQGKHRKWNGFAGCQPAASSCFRWGLFAQRHRSLGPTIQLIWWFNFPHSGWRFWDGSEAVCKAGRLWGSWGEYTGKRKFFYTWNFAGCPIAFWSR